MRNSGIGINNVKETKKECKRIFNKFHFFKCSIVMNITVLDSILLDILHS